MPVPPFSYLASPHPALDNVSMSRASQSERISASVIAALGLANFALQIVLSTDKSGSLLGALQVLTRFFTILTNAAVVVVMLRIAIGRRPDPRTMLALVTAIAMVGIVYHAILADLQTFTGLNALTDQGFHTAIPALTVLWWLAFSGRLPVWWQDLAWVLPWPVAYCVYALVRGAVTGIYPYPFLDLGTLGAATLAINVAALACVFLVVGFLFAGLAKLRRRYAPPLRRSTR